MSTESLELSRQIAQISPDGAIIAADTMDVVLSQTIEHLISFVDA